MRRWIVTTLAAVAVLGLVTGTAVVAFPSVAAAACPGCYGLHDLGDGVWAEENDDTYPAMIEAARERLAEVYGEQESDPRVLICSTKECYERIGGGGEKGRTVREWALMLSPGGASETIATHELNHVEFHSRLGSHKADVPHWFDEGLAVLVSDDSRYLAPAGSADRCLVPYEQAFPVTTMDWSEATRDGDTTGYLWAACVVSRWAAARPDDLGTTVTSLIADLRGGTAFGTAVVPAPPA